MQGMKFETAGGCVVHKVPYRSGRASVWFSPDGCVRDIEYFPNLYRDRTYRLKRGNQAWRIIEGIARTFAKYYNLF